MEYKSHSSFSPEEDTGAGTQSAFHHVSSRNALTNHGHEHGHDLNTNPNTNPNQNHNPDVLSGISPLRLFITMGLNFLITVVEIIGGLISGSLSLLSDALHNFSDGISIIVSYIALKISRRPQTSKYTFGLKRAEIIAAILNAGTLIVICFYFFREAYDRLVKPQTIDGGTMVIVASTGLLANIAGALLLRRGASGNLNFRSAYLHLLSDAMSSAAVILGGLAIIFLDVYWIDPILTILISLYILKESWDIVKEAVNVLMMGAPESISVDEICKDLERLEGVNNIHHIHIWRLNEKNIHFEAHVEVNDMLISDTHSIAGSIEKVLAEQHGVTHITLQFETDKCKLKSVL